jgi:hypothetical protein
VLVGFIVGWRSVHFALLVAAIGVGVMVHALITVPPAILLSDGEGSFDGPSPSALAASPRWALQRWLLRRAVFAIGPAAFSLFLMLMTMFAVWPLLLITWFLLAGFVSVIVAMAIPVLADVAHLPVSKRTLFAFVFLPSLAALGAGLALAESPWWPDVLRSEDRLVHYAQGKFSVPPWLWRVSDGGSPPTVRAPSGETFTPQTHLLPFGLVAWNPYEVGPGSSEAFSAYQLGRAAEDYCDRALWKQKGQKAPSALPNLQTFEYAECEPRTPGVRQAKCLLLGLVWFIGCGLVTVRNRPPPSLRAWRLRKATEFAMPFILFVGPMYLLRGDTLDQAILAHHVVARIGRALPHDRLLAWGVVAFLLVCAHWILQRRFDRMEVPAAVARNPLFGGTK